MIIRIGKPSDKRLRNPKTLGGMYAFIIVPKSRAIIIRWNTVKIKRMIPIYWILSRFFFQFQTNKNPIKAPPR